MQHRSLVVVSVPVLLLLLTGAVFAHEFERDFTFAAADLKVANLIGSVQVVAAEGDEFQVHVTVRGADATEEFLKFETSEDDEDVLTIRFPLKEHTRYVYPALGGHSTTTIHIRDESDSGNSWLKSLFSGLGGTKVTVRGKGSGKEVWADVMIAVPANAGLRVKQGVGEIQAADLQADLDLDTHSGDIAVRGLRGDLLADTGSGRVVAAGVVGAVDIDTGSGGVEVSNCEGQEIKVDTGSGRVVATGLKCEHLLIDTGSGSVKARQVEAERAHLDTGSGSVLLQLNRLGDGKFVIDTGSGAIELVLPVDASARVNADTGSGSLNNDFPGAQVIKQTRDEMELVVGGGVAQVVLDAGSGDISVRQE